MKSYASNIFCNNKFLLLLLTGIEAVKAIDIRGAKKIGFYHEEKEECWRP